MQQADGRRHWLQILGKYQFSKMSYSCLAIANLKIGFSFKF